MRYLRFRTIPVAISDHGATFDFVACRGPIYKVGVSCTREATFGAERIVWAVLGNHFPSKVAESDGRVAKNWRLGIRSRMLAEVVAARAPQDLPSTRAGGQDYGS